MADLSGLQVLVTRPEPEAGRWAEQLRQEGAQVLVAPLMDLEAVTGERERQAVKRCILDFDLYQKAIFVSRNAVAHAFDWLDQYWPQLPMGVTYYGVGERTARALAEQEVAVTAWQADGPMNSEALLASPELQSVAGERIVIFRGLGGRGLMGETLTERGARVDYCELYRRCYPADATKRLSRALDRADERPLVVALHSGETLDNYHRARQSLAPDGAAARRLARASLLVPGERVAERARNLGYQHLLQAQNATDPAMRAALHHGADTGALPV